jgi:hypothetical protein
MNLADAVIAEMARVRDQIMPNYYEIGDAGRPALVMMRVTLDAAARALAEQDAIKLLVIHQDLKGFTG